MASSPHGSQSRTASTGSDNCTTTGCLRRPGEVPVGIERPDGRLVDALLEAGHPVVPVKPHAIKQWRDGEVLSGAKSDAGDAEVIAEYLRLRAHRLRVATPYSGETKALRSAADIAELIRHYALQPTSTFVFGGCIR